MKISNYRMKVISSGLAALIMLSGCLEMGDSSNDNAGSDGGDSSSNRAPTISGSPSAAAKISEEWTFTPNASDPDGDSLTFSVENLPGWANFERNTGRISGTPTLGQVGTYSEIRISVSDGSLSASLPTFSVAVVQAALGAATLTWNPPTQNVDGTPLIELAAFKIYYGKSSGKYTNQVRIDNAGITTFVVEDLAPATYYFVATAVNSNGVESSFSNEATTLVEAP